jgi:phospholipase/lecithinase/hemolysin
MINFKKELLALTAASSLLVSGMSQAAISNLVSFGDSLSDSGNVHAMLGNFVAPYAGVNSDGPVWTGHLSQSLGLGAHTGSLTGGTAYGYAGARVNTPSFLVDPDVLAPGHPGVPNTTLQQQVDAYLASNGGAADPNTLFTVWGGANDALFAAATGDFSVVPAAAQGIASIADQLMNAGATSVLVMNLPNIGFTPRQNGNPTAAAQGDFISVQYNNALAAYVGGITAGRDIVIHDAYTWTGALVASGPSQGLNVTDMCFDADAGTLCSDPSNYMWWDEIHPTTAGHALLAADVLNTVNTLDVAAVPVPAAAWLFMSGLAGIAGLKRAKK